MATVALQSQQTGAEQSSTLVVQNQVAHDSDQRPSFSPSNLPIQTKLTIGSPNDRYEREADAMADRIMRMPADRGSRQPLGRSVNSIQRKCAACAHDEEQLQRKPLMMKSEGEEAPYATPGLQSRLNSSKGSGAPLSDSTNQFMSQAFGTDFSNVRIHTGGSAIQMNRDLNAKAFTHGSDIYFNRGQYRPDSGEGKRLLGHELTHVVQQNGTDSGRTSTIMDEVDDAGRIGQRIQKQGAPAPSRCCCCIDSIDIKNITQINTASRMGHSFDTHFKMSYGAAAADRPVPLLDSCNLEWWEKTNVPYTPSMVADTWTDMTKDPATSGSFAGSWARRTEPCPGTETIVDTDPPSLARRPGRTVTRTLEFRIRVDSAGNCSCTNGHVEATATQVLAMVNGAPDWANSSFTTP